jgi:hypothetical protein
VNKVNHDMTYVTLIHIGQRLIDRVCYDLNDDIQNCGNVGSMCPLTFNSITKCIDGVCVSQCISGYINVDGICVKKDNNPDMCGIHGLVCTSPTHGTPTCDGNKCNYVCNEGYTRINDTCVNINVSGTHCGSAHNTCTSPESVCSYVTKDTS